MATEYTLRDKVHCDGQQVLKLIVKCIHVVRGLLNLLLAAWCCSQQEKLMSTSDGEWVFVKQQRCHWNSPLAPETCNFVRSSRALVERRCIFSLQSIRNLWISYRVVSLLSAHVGNGDWKSHYFWPHELYAFYTLYIPRRAQFI